MNAVQSSQDKLASRKKRLFRVVRAGAVIVLLCLVIAVISPVHIHKRSWDKAYFEWQKNPTPETQAAFREEQREFQFDYLIAYAQIEAVLVGVGWILYWGIKETRKRVRY